MIVNGIIISNDKNKFQIKKILKNISGSGLSNVKSVKGSG